MSDIIDNDDLIMRQQEWLDALKLFDMADIRKALDYCRDNLAFPPAISDFRILIREFKKAESIPKETKRITLDPLQRERNQVQAKKLYEMALQLAKKKRYDR